MIARVIIDRANKAARIEVEKVIDACWLGTKFAVRYPELVAADWNIICEAPGALSPVGAERHLLEGSGGLPFETTTYWVDTIAAWIANPPQYLHADCPQCRHAENDPL